MGAERCIMRVDNQTPDMVVLGEFGSRLAGLRLNRNITQSQLAHEAGVSRSALEHLEAGHATSVLTLLRVLRVLELVGVLDKLIPVQEPSPMALLKLHRDQRLRATGRRGKIHDDKPNEYQT